MAASTYTTTLTQITVFGNKRVHLLTFTISSYGTDGVPVTTALAGMATLDLVIPFLGGTGLVANGPVQPFWNATTGYITLLKATNAGCDAGTNVGSVSPLYALVIGS